MRPGIAVGLGVDNQHALADLGLHRAVAGERADLAVQDDMARGQGGHHRERVLHRRGVALVCLVIPLFVARHVEILLAYIVDPVVAEPLAGAVPEPVPGQHHHRPAHAGDHVVGDHHPARRAVIDVGAGLGRLPAQHHLLARLDQSEPAAAERAGRGVEVDIVVHLVGRRVLQSELDIVAFVADHQRPRDRPVIGKRVDLGAVVVDDPLLLVHGELDLDDLRTPRVVLVVFRRERRRDERLPDPLHALHVGLRRGVAFRRHHHRAHGPHRAQRAAGLENLSPVELLHGWCLLDPVSSPTMPHGWGI